MASLFLAGSKIGSHFSQHQYSPIYVLHLVSLSRIISAVANDYDLFNRPWQETPPFPTRQACTMIRKQNPLDRKPTIRKAL